MNYYPNVMHIYIVIELNKDIIIIYYTDIPVIAITIKTTFRSQN